MNLLELKTDGEKMNKQERLNKTLDKLNEEERRRLVYKTEEEAICRCVEEKLNRLRKINPSRFYKMCDWINYEVRPQYNTQQFNKKLKTFIIKTMEETNGK